MSIKSKALLGQLLLEKGIISESQLNQALRKQEETGEMLGQILLQMGFVDEEKVFLPILAGQMGVDLVNLKDRDIAPEVIQKIPAKFASHYKVVPFEFEKETLTVAATNPNDLRLLDELAVVVNAKIRLVIAPEKDILEAIRKYYGVGAETIERMMDTVGGKKSSEPEISQIDEIESEASISNFLNQILYEAYRDRASDIHIEPFENELQIRYRVDGVLHDAKVPKNIVHFKDAINSRIKILSNLNIAEKRLPQDGRFKVRVKGVDIDLRVSFLPSQWGESVVMRLLNSTTLYNFEQLGLADSERKTLESLIFKPHGIIYLTGPTGSGKTTTLYSCLSKVNTEDKKIITIEDPVEYQLKGVTQIQINPAIKLTFAQGLRSMLRHDPDIMMVGEVRDLETAEISIQAALTGHLMFSTLHTNDAAGGVARLLDMGVEPYLITSTVLCFIAQRLVRVICPDCKAAVKATPDILEDFAQEAGGEKELTIYEGKGCENCKMTGYSGRAGIYEFLVLNDDIKNLIIERATSDQIKDMMVKKGIRTLRQAGWEKVRQGVTTPAEVIRVTQEEE